MCLQLLILVLTTLLAVAQSTIVLVKAVMSGVKSNVKTTASKSVRERDGGGTVVGMMRKSASMIVTRLAPETVTETTEF